jgi:1-acyl-sn-glycerol-3-phosphate acyltransferase
VRAPPPEILLPLVWALGRAYFGVRHEGVQQIPREGPLIIAPNHVSYADPPLVGLPVGRPVHFMAWNRLFQVPLFGPIIRYLRAFPVETESADPRATREAVRLLRAGRALLIFPEGGRTRDGRLQRFKPGAFRLACAHGAPVLPVTIVGGYESWPPHRALPRPGRVTIYYHPPVVPAARGDRREAASELARRVRAAIASRLPPHQRPADGE